MLKMTVKMRTKAFILTIHSFLKNKTIQFICELNRLKCRFAQILSMKLDEKQNCLF